MRKTRNCRLIFILILALALLLLGNSLVRYDSAQDSADPPSSFQEYAAGRIQPDGPVVSVAGHSVTLWQQDGSYYAFLPAACRSNPALAADLPEEIGGAPVIRLFSAHLPAVFIDTTSETFETIDHDKNYREPATLTVLTADGEVSLYQPLEYIKSRGNKSYLEFDKKPYQIKFAEEVPLLGMEEGKTWILLANASDPTLLRNALARNLAKHLGLAQSDDGVFIDLYLNGSYAGNYYVTEKVEVKENRLDITDLETATENVNTHSDLSVYGFLQTETSKAAAIPNDPADITGGYLIERDFKDRFLREEQDNGSYFISDAGECFILRSPSCVSEKQLAYISRYVQSAENAILAPNGVDPSTGRPYTELIDADSFARKYLLEEVTANYDGGVASSYFYKDADRVDGRLYAGPVWDYDVSFGNTPAYLGYLSDRPDTLTKLSAHQDASPWFSALYKKPDFYALITDCYAREISSYLTWLAEQTLPELAETTAASAQMDRIRWRDQYRANDGGESLEESLAFLSDYIIARRDFLDQIWIEKRPTHQVTLYVEDAIYDTYTVFDGDSLPVPLPIPELPYAEFQRWVTEEGLAADFSSPVRKDMSFYAVLK